MKFGQYELLERVAIGGMAEVYRGRVAGVEGFEKSVAIKRILPEFARDDRFISMMLTEARIHSALSHRNILQIHDLGISEDGEYFIVLEYVEGHDLRAVMEAAAELGVQIPDSLALHVADELAQALHFAHELTDETGQPLGIIHRDVSPSNVLISNSGEVKLSDFGIAKRRNDHSFVGSLKGNLAYMSPEQARRVPLDRRTDVFSLGAVLFEMLTGHKLREISDEVNGFREVASGRVRSARTLRSDLPEAYEALLARALAADPADRFPDAAAFGVAIRELARESATPVGPADMKELVELLSPPRRARSPVEISKVIRLGPEFKVLAGSARSGRTMGLGDDSIASAIPSHLRVSHQPTVTGPISDDRSAERADLRGGPIGVDKAAANLAVPTPNPTSPIATRHPVSAPRSEPNPTAPVATPRPPSAAQPEPRLPEEKYVPHQTDVERGAGIEAFSVSHLPAVAAELDNLATPPPPTSRIGSLAPPFPADRSRPPSYVPPIDGAISMATPPPNVDSYHHPNRSELAPGPTWNPPSDQVPAPPAAFGSSSGAPLNSSFASNLPPTTAIIARDRLKRRRPWRSIGVILLAGLCAGAAVIHYKYVPLDVAAVWFTPASMFISSDPSGASVTLDGRLVPERTPTRIEIRRDRDDHILEVSREGSLTVRTTARFDRAVVLSETVILPPQPLPPAPPAETPPAIPTSAIVVPEAHKTDRVEGSPSDRAMRKEGFRKKLGHKAARNSAKDSSKKPAKKSHQKKSGATDTAET
jgi:serine/threonine protein kinase